MVNHHKEIGILMVVVAFLVILQPVVITIAAYKDANLQRQVNELRAKCTCDEGE